MTDHLALTVVDRHVDGPHGAIPVRVYSRAAPAYGLVWAHGGAFVAGDLDMPESDWVARQIAGAGAVVVAVDYRLAPSPQWSDRWGTGRAAGHRFPVASEEVAAAFAWSASGEPDVSTWFLGGASAGANLAAGAALRLRDGRGPLPAGLVLAYPLVHHELPAMSPELVRAYRHIPEHKRFSPETVVALNRNYVQTAADLANPYAFPGGHDLVGLPPTLIVNSDRDSLRASGERFAAELALAGVDVTVVREPGTWHGHLNEPETDGAHRSIDRVRRWLGLQTNG